MCIDIKVSPGNVTSSSMLRAPPFNIVRTERLRTFSTLFETQCTQFTTNCVLSQKGKPTLFWLQLLCTFDKTLRWIHKQWKNTCIIIYKICFNEIISEIAYLHLLLIRQFHMIFISMNHRKYITRDDTKSQLNADYMKKCVVYGAFLSFKNR